MALDKQFYPSSLRSLTRQLGWVISTSQGDRQARILVWCLKHSKYTWGKGSYQFWWPLLEWHLEISSLVSLGVWMELYGPKMGPDWWSNADSGVGASSLRGVRRVPLGRIQPLGLSQPKNDPLWEFPMQLWRIWVSLKIVFFSMFKMWARRDYSSTPMPGRWAGKWDLKNGKLMRAFKTWGQHWAKTQTENLNSSSRKG